jgi:hypothetical protein
MFTRIIFACLSTVLIAAGPAMAADGLTLNDFSPNTPARADSVNENFAEIEDAIPVMWASIDQDPAAVAFTPGPVPGAIINDLPGIIVPDPGILLISGSVFVNNDGPFSWPFTLNPLIDGLAPDGHTSQAFFVAAPDNAIVAEGFTLSYTYAVAVAASTYDVTQELAIAGGGPSMFTYNRNNLTVVFFPSLPGGAPINTPPIPAGAVTLPIGQEDGDISP